jgi:hypothetical protein
LRSSKDPVGADIDIYRTANLLIKQHGVDDAKRRAAQRADKVLARGDVSGSGTWIRYGYKAKTKT